MTLQEFLATAFPTTPPDAISVVKEKREAAHVKVRRDYMKGSVQKHWFVHYVFFRDGDTGNWENDGCDSTAGACKRRMMGYE